MRALRYTLTATACLAALAGGVTGAASAATPHTAARAAASAQNPIDAVDFMVGTWVGSGWNIGPQGVRDDFFQTERVTKEVQDTLVLVRGQGYEKSDPTKIADSALAVLNYNNYTQQYRWEAFAGGNVAESTPVVGADYFQWSLSYPGAQIRYTLTFTAQTWHEIGETSVDGGQTWSQTFQMDLQKVS